jgi:uncharacterized membrane protein
MFEPLLRTAAAVGVTLDISTSKALADSLDRAVVGPLALALSICMRPGYRKNDEHKI